MAEQRFITAIADENTKKIAVILKNGTDINSILTEQKFTSLHVAVWYRAQEALKFLLDKGANPNAQAIGNITPIHLAALDDWQEGITLLTQYNADPNIVSWGKTPLSLITMEDKNQLYEPITLKEFLISHGARETITPDSEPSEWDKMPYSQYFERLLSELYELKVVKFTLCAATVGTLFYLLKSYKRRKTAKKLQKKESHESATDAPATIQIIDDAVRS